LFSFDVVWQTEVVPYQF